MTKFEQFAKEKTYLLGVSPRTVEWYEQSLRWLTNASPSEQDLKDAVVKMRTAGLKASSCNSRIRAINSYLTWLKSPLRIPKLKEPQFLPQTFSKDDISKFLHYRPKNFYRRRLQLLVCLLADSGARISEALGLRWDDVNFDDCLMTLHGKGDKSRIVPFSQELRKLLWRFRHEHKLVFSTRDGGRLGRRDMLRDTKLLCRELGVSVPVRCLHAFRHSFATQYLRAGGNVFALQRCLGHTDLTMTKKYVSLLTEDLQAIHAKVSLLSM